jgi:hypothetical protein
MLYEEVDNLIHRYDEEKKHIRFNIMDKARKVVIEAAKSGSKKSMMYVTHDQLSEVEWLKKELRSEGVSTSVQGEMLSFNVTGPRARGRRPRNNALDPDDNYPSHAY